MRNYYFSTHVLKTFLLIQFKDDFDVDLKNKPVSSYILPSNDQC